MEREGGIPRWLIAALVALVLVIGALAYYAGRFKREGKAPPTAALELPEPGPPSPDGEEPLPTPGDVPPTVTPSAAVLIEKTSRTSSGVMVERSSQVVVPVASERIPTARPSTYFIEDAAPRSRIAVEIATSPRPSPTPTVPELERTPPQKPLSEVTPEPPPGLAPPPPPTPEPPAFPPTPGVSAGSVRSACAS